MNINSLWGKFGRCSPWWVAPISRAERTIYWFMFGEKFGYPPKHPNCRCVTIA